MPTPKLLAPCGSYDALCSAISAGADEVYFGSSLFNARMNAKNFDKNEFENAIKLCRMYGVKSNITLNTLTTDRELRDTLNLAYDAMTFGADAFIIQDLGLASLLKQTFPDICLHASTQCACHNTLGARELSKLGFSRIVVARELSQSDIEAITLDGKQNNYEIEMFIHGALCVSHSGMCLMSSCIGKRSGNRGLCAQPCRLKYSFDGKNSKELLSLKDLCLASKIDFLCKSNVASLKIEGRMKSPEYVYGVTKLYRKLLDQKRNATKDELQFLYELFSRNGFTDAYFTKQYLSSNASMYGVRSDSQKAKTAVLEKKQVFEMPKIPVDMSCTIQKDKCIELSINNFKYISDIVPDLAQSRPIDNAFVSKCLDKTGSTSFQAKNIEILLDNNLFLTASQLNNIRRTAFEEYKQNITKNIEITKNTVDLPKPADNSVQKKPVSISESFLIGLSRIKDKDFNKTNFAVEMPRVIFDTEVPYAIELLKKAKQMGACFAIAHNISHLEMCKQAELPVFGGIGLNVFNSKTVEYFENKGVYALTLSPELNPAQSRDIVFKSAKKAVIKKARLPLMVLESCIYKAHCNKCQNKKGKVCSYITDRMGMTFPLLSQERLTPNPYPCRLIVQNSLISKLSDQKTDTINPDIVFTQD